MNKIVFGLVVLMVLAFVSGSMAQPKPAPAPEKPKMEKFRGVIEKVDEAAKTVEVKGRQRKEEKTLTFATDDKTKILRVKKELALADLKDGMHVFVGYKKEGDKMIAALIKVTVPRAAKKEKPAEK
jgi:Cu/Ag efflux protein CusF